MKRMMIGVLLLGWIICGSAPMTLAAEQSQHRNVAILTDELPGCSPALGEEERLREEIILGIANLDQLVSVLEKRR